MKFLEYISTLQFAATGAERVLLTTVILCLTALVLRVVFRKNFTLKFSQLLLRCVTILLLAAAWCLPFTPKPGTGIENYILVDVSKSISSTTASNSLEKLAQLKLSNARHYAFASELKETNSYATQHENWRTFFSEQELDNTNLEQALLEIEQRSSANKQIILVSDGYETKGDVLGAYTKASYSRIYPILPNVSDNVAAAYKLTNLSYPQIVDVGKQTIFGVTVSNSYSVVQQGVITVLVNGEKITTQNVQIAAKSAEVFKFESGEIKEGINQIEVVLEPTAQNQIVSKLSGFISGKTREKVLMLSGNSAENGYLEQVLKEQAYSATSLVAGNINEQIFEGLSSYAAVIFNNIQISALPQNAASRVKDYVNAGGGFIMLGGNQSFGLGGYLGTSIDDILPVKLLPPQQEKKRLNVAVQLVLDQSGSMKEQSKIEHAKAAAQAVVNGLKEDDYIGVISFTDTPFELFPMSPVAGNRERAMQRIELMFPGTTTNLSRALDIAKSRLESAKAGRKHMIILTDGKLPDGIRNRAYYLRTSDQLRRTGMTVSTFLIGNEYDIILKDIAEIGGGAFYRTNSLSNLPRLFLEDIRISTGEKTQKEGQVFDVQVVDPGITSTELRSFPSLLGYVETLPKAEANLELNVYANRRADPLLASWNVGQGRAIAYTADASGRWSRQWISWAKFQQFWSNIVDSAANFKTQAKNPHYEFNTYVKSNALVIETTIYTTPLPENLKLEVEKPDATKVILPLNSLATGHFQSSLIDPIAGNYKLQLFANDTKLTPVGIKIDATEIGERTGLGYNSELLAELAARSGGVINPQIKDLDATLPVNQEQEFHDHWFILAAIILLLAEIALRELGRFSFKYFK